MKNSNAVTFSEVVNIVEHRTYMIVILSVDRVLSNNGCQPDPLL